MKSLLIIATSIVLSGCVKTTTCYGVTDAELLDRIQRGYAHSRQTPEMARYFRLNRERVVAVERFGQKGQDAFAGMLFRQDDGTFLSIRIFEDCTFQTSGGKDQSDLKNWVYRLVPPRF